MVWLGLARRCAGIAGVRGGLTGESEVGLGGVVFVFNAGVGNDGVALFGFGVCSENWMGSFVIG